MAVNIFKIKESKEKIKQSITEFFGVGSGLAKHVCKRFGISPDLTSFLISRQKLLKLRIFLEKKAVVENKLRFFEKEALKKLLSNNSYRGIRLASGLPVRGQRTKSNGKTQKSRRFRLVTRQ